jgi:hypothetical protein
MYDWLLEPPDATLHNVESAIQRWHSPQPKAGHDYAISRCKHLPLCLALPVHATVTET